jgi:glycine C-acetyltransferase
MRYNQKRISIIMKKIERLLNYIEENDLYPDLRIIQGSATPEVIIDGKKVLMFSSNNYLSLSTHPRIMQAAIEATKTYGVGSGGSRLLSGNLEVHRKLEKKIVEFKGGEDAIVYPCGYSANVGVIPAVTKIMKLFPVPSILERKSVILSDALNHASIIDGCRMSGQEVVVYRHSDMEDLERKLSKHKRRRKMIITDGVFSMDGDIAPLDKISLLAKKYGAMSMVDEAHATGVLGDNGRGSMEYFNLRPIEDIDIVMGTLSKALGSSGGFVIGSKKLVKYLRVASRSYMFSTAITPAASAAAVSAINIIQNEPVWKKELWENTNYMKNGFRRMGYNTLGSQTQIVPILIGDEKKAIQFSRLLFEKGIFGPCVRWPAVEKGKARVRFTVMKAHTVEQIDKLLHHCEEIGRRLNII